jgi:2-(1,2-epoxy-1,2-dihydrophenyl)acetyl-CoA isomerase
MEQQRANMKRHHRLARTIYAIEKPVIAEVDGVAFGAGFSVALLTDLILASDCARFCMAFGRVGLVPDYGALLALGQGSTFGKIGIRIR